MGGEMEKMVAVGLVWGATNALMRKGALKWDEKLRSSSHPDTPQHPVLKILNNWFNLLLTWQYSLPFLLNLSASAAFFAILSDTPISVAVPVTNGTTFAATAVFGMLLGEETRVGFALFGTFLIVLGVYICVM
ncbi:transmembrane protein 234 homolog [Ipomoea triloba]|uniref:transmembrane protein 234 homolog n=1 Tax=Ipomoea triloba TaxID=35885 RepID=UPI00125E1055|nr:transmembrane protein 234 homolog [Ipomoea triloba]